MSNRSKPKTAADLSYRDIVGVTNKDPLPPLVLLANAEDERTGDASEIYAFQKPSDRFGIEKVAREKAFNPDSLAQALIAKNGQLPRDREAASTIVETASAKSPREHWLFVRNDGWQPNFTAFSHRGQIFGSAAKPQLILKPPLSNNTRKFALSQAGTPEGWQQVMHIAHYSTRLRLALCAAFAAPLLRVVDLQSFSIVLAGKSKAGKSTALLAAGSVIGIGLEGGLPNFNATPSALQETAAEFVDRVLPVNEIGLVSGPRKDAYQILRPLTYRYSEGRDTARHSKSAYGTDGAPLEWRGIMLVSSENTFEALAELAAEKRDEGEYARAFDVPALHSGNTTIFDSFPRGLPIEGREQWAREKLVELRRICANHHGHAFDTYVAFLVANRATLRRKVEFHMQMFMDSMRGRQLSGALQHAARNFAILYAGAAMADKAGVGSRWTAESTLVALTRCFDDGLREISNMQSVEERARAKLLHRIGSVGELPSAGDQSDCQAWYTRKPNGERIFCVRSAHFADWFAEPAELRAAVKWLWQSKLLSIRDGQKPDLPNTEWAITFPKLDGKGARSYQFKDPTSYN
ncbi:DUF927 domain-containing protein [Lichenihabitans psoromatis]|uniref:DUF927 domain-containing protein n=1 Tax=Lichenihabitans psoromatis TaxID=2528642 RepID=UPI00103598E1|nr:DUF927 domain-containing protein [Lichenihabitans psoromatis]